jgi:methylated-DNA-[protein]-cysteine S-methyltransferase
LSGKGWRYLPVPTPFGELAIVWSRGPGGPRVRQVILHRPGAPAARAVRAAYPGAARGSCAAVTALAAGMRRFLRGAAVSFDLDRVALETCGDFQRRVLLAEHRIPRGRVSTYGRIALRLGVPGAARAVGRALARNPFPIIIPCHRAVRADGTLGGYQGGRAMKRALLELEGVAFGETGRVRLQDLHDEVIPRPRRGR